MDRRNWQLAEDRQREARRWAEDERLADSARDGESATSSHLKLKLALALTAAILILLLVTAFITHAASAAGIGGVGGGHFLLY